MNQRQITSANALAVSTQSISNRPQEPTRVVVRPMSLDEYEEYIRWRARRMTRR